MQHRSLTGQVTLRGRSVLFESSLERDFLVLLDFDPTVLNVVEQPFRIGFKTTEGRRGRYTPDFLVDYDGGIPTIYEVKYRETLREEWSRLRPRFRAAVHYARLNGMRFSVITDHEIRSPYLANVRFLRQYLDRPREPDTEEHLVATLATLGETTPGTLLTAAYWTQENRMRAIAPLWRLIAIRRVQADLSHPLTMTSPIWIVPGEGFQCKHPLS